MKTNRGFERQDFYDDFGLECSIQESSSAIPHIWLGVNHAPVKVMRKDLSGISTSMPSPECNERGWCTINLILMKILHLQDPLRVGATSKNWRKYERLQ